LGCAAGAVFLGCYLAESSLGARVFGNAQQGRALVINAGAVVVPVLTTLTVVFEQRSVNLSARQRSAGDDKKGQKEEINEIS
jgi:serine acetyltransferase